MVSSQSYYTWHQHDISMPRIICMWVHIVQFLRAKSWWWYCWHSLICILEQIWSDFIINIYAWSMKGHLHRFLPFFWQPVALMAWGKYNMDNYLHRHINTIMPLTEHHNHIQFRWDQHTYNDVLCYAYVQARLNITNLCIWTSQIINY